MHIWQKCAHSFRGFTNSMKPIYEPLLRIPVLGCSHGTNLICLESPATLVFTFHLSGFLLASLSHILASYFVVWCFPFRDWGTYFSKCLSTKMVRSRVDFWGREIPVWRHPRRQVMFFHWLKLFLHLKSGEVPWETFYRAQEKLVILQRLIAKRYWYASKK